ncbi:dihydrodipicolinate synthase family protein [Natrinema longum]|uniref:Dihydrodipicolinate synthase family protein n=1 Tax=Natrinema longum TaxID=370324 RepID=A0A8A2UAI0_9EURY|nr:dihydrodipicolinate synthase family protein [Natrinema longum]MBZ6496270.1 dihydrodipicolinate synthase family protein [Natrinema longum]QSW85811.1 dihydrodipicolinate synthase family protein [Natrinema longum]
MVDQEPGAADPLSLRGVVPPTVTAFHDDESVDYDRTADHARFVVDRGVHGVFPLGTNGEFPLLSGDERDRVVTAVVEEVGDEVPVIAGVGAPSTYQTVAHAEHAESVGADGLVVVTPYYYPLDREGTLEHYRRVADAVSLPVYVYHIPSKTGNELPLETLAELAERDVVVGVKDSSKDVPWLAQAIDRNPELTFLAGSDSLIFTGLEIGCSGAVSAVANAFPELVVECYEAFTDGDEDRAQELQSTIFDVRDAFKTGGAYMSGVKTALRMREFDVGPLRSPLRLKDDDSAAELREGLADLDGVLDGRLGSH